VWSRTISLFRRHIVPGGPVIRRHPMSYQGHAPSGRAKGMDSGPIQVRSLASGGVAHRSTSAPRKVQPYPLLQPALQHPQQPQPQPHHQRRRLEGGRAGGIPTPSVRSLATGRIRIGSFACGTLHQCEDPSLYIDDDEAHQLHNRNVESLIVKLSTSLPLTKTATCETSTDDTLCTAAKLNPAVADSVLILDTSNNTVVEELLDPPPHHWQHQLRQHSTAIVPSRRHRNGATTTQNKKPPKPAGDYSYQHIIRNFLTGNTTCYVGDDDVSSLAASYDGNLHNANNINPNAAFLNCFVMPQGMATSTGQMKSLFDADTTSPLSPIRSLMRASFPKSLFVPAYDDSTADHAAGSEDDTNYGSIAGSRETATTLGQREVQYFKRRLDHATRYYGKVHSQTADASYNLGEAQLRNFHYDLALENFARALAICRSLHREDRFHLSIGRALDAMGLAVLRSSAKQQQPQPQPQGNHQRMDALQEAQRLLEQAFAIRHHHLGVWHVDTVETYNRLASVQLHLGRLNEACHAYQEVFYVRQAIFGRTHPSVAISAHSVANCYYKLGGPEHVPKSLEWYRRALDIYEAMALPYHHPAVSKLLKDQSRLEKYLLAG
jgi:hypothetical protein